MIINPTPIMVNNLMINSILSQQNTSRVRKQEAEVEEKPPKKSSTLHEFVNKELKREDVISLQEFVDKEMGK